MIYVYLFFVRDCLGIKKVQMDKCATIKECDCDTLDCGNAKFQTSLKRNFEGRLTQGGYPVSMIVEGLKLLLKIGT